MLVSFYNFIIKFNKIILIKLKNLVSNNKNFFT